MTFHHFQLKSSFMSTKASSIHDVARVAGVSPATVSRVINNRELVNHDKVILVEKAIENLGYRPQQRRRRRKVDTGDSIAGRTLNIFGLVVPELQGGIFSSLQAGFNEQAQTHNHQTLVCSTDENVHKQADALMQLMDNHVAGVAIAPVISQAFPAHHVRLLQRYNVPVVMLHHRFDGVSAPCITLPIEAVVENAIKAFADRGHRQIAMVAGERSAVVDRFDAAFEQSLMTRGLTYRPDWVYRSDDWPLTAEDETRLDVFLEKFKPSNGHLRPTAAFVTYDVLANIALIKLNRIGVESPRDMSILSTGTDIHATPLGRELSAVTVDERAAGRTAARLLEEMSRGERALNNDEQFTMDIGLYKGSTLQST